MGREDKAERGVQGLAFSKGCSVQGQGSAFSHSVSNDN